MMYREYERTGKKLSLLGFGGLRLHDQDTVDEAGVTSPAPAMMSAVRLR
jgi:predicted aldo/keto reductase-like oxidoreductase